jgi:hypothetical protein
MSEKSFQDSWMLLTRAAGTGTWLRILVALGPVAALTCLTMAASRTVIVVDIAVMVLVACCVVVPDTHFGTLVVTIIGVAWLVSVHHTVSPWSLGLALSLLVFHTALAAASIAAPSATWSPALRRRWLRRSGVLALACVATWLVVAVVHGHRLSSSATLLVAALALLAFAAMWARDVALHRGALRTTDDVVRR